jgi:hypothetical protein
LTLLKSHNVRLLRLHDGLLQLCTPAKAREGESTNVLGELERADRVDTAIVNSVLIVRREVDETDEGGDLGMRDDRTVESVPLLEVLLGRRGGEDDPAVEKRGSDFLMMPSARSKGIQQSGKSTN